MVEKTRYRRVETLGKTTGSCLYRAWRSEDGEPVLVKQPDPKRPDAAQEARLRREYEVLRSLDVPGVAHPIALVEESGGLTMILENFPGEPLEGILERGRMDLATCLRAMSRLAGILATVHHAQLIHNGIQPANLLFHSDDCRICVVDFSLATSSGVEVCPAGMASGFAEKDLPYVSPEQTGRMNRPIDHRTDFYSLGVCFYRMLTGRLPFQVHDALEWVHCHIARVPPSPGEVAPEIPQPVADIVCKLLAKTADERYQSALGLQFDLEHCLAQWEAKQRIDAFPLGERDLSDRFRIPQRLYGREAEIRALHAAFDQTATADGVRVVLLTGPAGIGKSSLAYALLQRVEQERGYFLSGKFDQFQQNIPYAAIADAFQKLAQRILGESDARIAEWRQRFSTALEGNGRLILDVIPQFELILGAQPEVAALPPQEAQYRFHRAFRQFLDVVIGSGHTLALFLDDLQSADTASLELLRHLLAEPGPPAWLLIGAWRDQEAGLDHPLQRLLAAARQTRDPLEIRLAPLDARAIGRLAADTLHCAPASARPLTRVIERKTDGNPFFINQFLHMLHRDGLIAFDPQRARWIWHLAQIRDVDVTGNVVALMADQIGRLPPATQKLLTLAACLGDRFTLGMLAAIAREAPDRLARQLLPAVQRGMLLAWDQDPGLADRRYRWLHDRIRQAAHSLLAASELPRVHLDIGRALLAANDGRDPDEHLFEAANHLNAGAAQMTEAQERRRLVELNLRAGRKAKAAVAHAAAIRYLCAGIALLDGQAWTHDYALAFALHFEQAECEFLDGNPDAAIALASLAMARAQTRHDIALACQLKETSQLAKGEVAESVATTLEGLALLGIALPAHPTPEDAAAERARLRELLNGRSIESLMDLPAMTDPEQAAPMLIQTASYFTDPNLYVLHVARMVALSLEHGNADASLMWYGCYSLILAGFGEYEDAQRFAALAYGLMERRKVEAFKTRACFYLAVSSFWTRPLEEATAQAREGFGTLKETGDLISADYCGRLALVGTLDQRTLDEAREETMRLLEFGRRVSSRDLVDTCLLVRQFIDTLRDQNGDDGDGETFDPARLQHGSLQDRCSILGSWYWIFRLRADFLLGNYEQALAASGEAMPLLWVTACFIPYRDFCLYYALTLAALFDRAAPGQKETWLPLLRTQQAQLRRWSGLNPSTFRHADALVAAEIARIDGQSGKAMRRYEESIQWARDGRFIHDEALACELAGRFYQAQGFTVLAELHLKEARSCHARWGAGRKVRQLESLYPQLADRAPGAARRSAIARLDALSVIKASQAISGEIVLDRLLDTLMRILLENAGAQRGFLVLVRKERMTLAAEARVDQEKVQVQVRVQEEPPPSALPQSILNYVRHSGEKVLLADAREPNPFSQDSYLVQRHPKSVLCLPILCQSELSGLLYLENNLATHAFTPDRLAVLELLASQAAISLANARLYDDVREREARIQRLVESNIIGIVFCDIRGNILEANDTVARIVGYTREELLSGDIRWTDLVPPEYGPTVERSIAEGVTTGSCTPYEVEYIRKDGSRVPVLVGGALFEGSRDTGVAFVLDLSERKQAEAERQARRSAEAANAAKSAFLASMSHELKTPLNTILGFSHLMQRGTNLPPEVREDLAIVLRSGEHLSALLTQVLDLAKAEAGDTTLNETDFDLAALLAEIKGMFAYKAGPRGVALRFEHKEHGNLPRFIHADPVKLRRVLVSLLDHALKSTRQGSVTMRLAYFPTAAGLRLGVAVEDSGTGTGTPELAPLLAPFARTGTGQTAQTAQEAQEGTGLGLAISRSFVRLMGGELRIDSRPGKGTTISFDIPVRPGRAEAAARPASTAGSQVVALAPDQPRYRILVADDAPETRGLLQRLLAPLGFDVRLADNGQEAIDIWQSWHPHLIWMDMRMPLVDGRAATRHIKAQALGDATVIIALTASIFEEDRAEILKAGCADILVKPFREADLFALMEKHLGVRFVRRNEPAPAAVTTRLEADALAPLPDALRTALEQAVIRLDTQALKDVLAQIRAHDAKLAQALEAMAGEFEYERILQLIRQADGRMEHDGDNSGNFKFE